MVRYWPSLCHQKFLPRKCMWGWELLFCCWYNSYSAPSVPFNFLYKRLYVPWIFYVGIWIEDRLQWTKVAVQIPHDFLVILVTSKNGIWTQLPNPTMICMPVSLHILFWRWSRSLLPDAWQCSCIIICLQFGISKFWNVVPPMNIYYFVLSSCCHALPNVISFSEPLWKLLPEMLAPILLSQLSSVDSHFCWGGYPNFICLSICTLVRSVINER